ncbi:MAG: hypothetical protein MJE77_01175 [Proteobacteria bacterium]|nr:hypothetical protein [Pseudomonadota bacterium]
MYAVFEVNQTIKVHTLDYAADKIASVRQLQRTSVAMVSSGKIVPERPLFDIVGGILARGADWTDGLGDAFLQHWDKLDGDQHRRIDCSCALADGCFDRFSPPPTAACSASSIAWARSRQWTGIATLQSSNDPATEGSCQNYRPGDTRSAHGICRFGYTRSGATYRPPGGLETNRSRDLFYRMGSS